MWRRLLDGKKTVLGTVLLAAANVGPVVAPQYAELWTALGQLAAALLGAGIADKIRKAG